MRSSKKLLVLLLALCILASIAACGSGSNSNNAATTAATQQNTSAASTNSDTSVKKEAVNLKFMIVAGNDEMPAWKGITDSFNKNNPDINLTLEQLPGTWDDYNQKVTALFAAGTPPDIGRMAVALMPQYISKGQVVDLTPYVTKDLNMSDYYESAFKSSLFDGKNYGIPIGIYTRTLYYNKTLFDEAGLEYPSMDWDNPWTMEQFRDAARKLTKGDGPNKVFGYSVALDTDSVAPFLFSNGGNFLNDTKDECTLNSDPSKQVFKMLQDMVYVDKSSPTPSQLKTMPSDQMFMSNRLAMLIDGSWMMPEFSKKAGFKFGVAAVPKGASGSITANFIDQYVVFVGSKHVDDAWQAVKSFIGTDAENIMVDNNVGGVPMLKSVATARKADMFNPLAPEEKDVWFNSVGHSKQEPFTPNWAEIKDKMMKTLDLLGLNQIPSDQALDKVKADVDPMLKK